MDKEHGVTMQDDWQKYVSLSPDFTAQERSEIVKSLEFIALAKDGEGIKLLQAAANNSDQPVLIAPSKNGNFCMQGIVGIDFTEAEKVTFNDQRTGHDAHPSLNGILVHELFHATQPATNGLRKIGKLREEINKLTDIPEEDKVPLADALYNYTQQSYNAQLTESLREGFTTRGLNTDTTRPEILDQYAITDQQIVDYVGKGEILDKDGISETEQAATHFTDAFMAKNGEGKEPNRGNYSNAKMGNQLDNPIIIDSNNKASPSIGYAEFSNPDAPSSSAATVTPVGFEQAIRDTINSPSVNDAKRLESPIRLPADFDLSAFTKIKDGKEQSLTEQQAAGAPVISNKTPPSREANINSR